MNGGALSRSFEEILTAVEQDESLKHGEVAVEDQETRDGTDGNDGTPDGGASGLGTLLPPELMLRLPALLKAVGSMTEPMPRVTSRPATPEALLCALRPYLGERRQQAIDAMIRISRLSGTLGSLR